VIFIVVLLGERDARVLISHSHAQGRAAGTDGERPIAQLPGQIERLPQRLLLRQAQRVLSHLRFDTRAHLARRAEVAVRRGESFDPLMRALEVVVLDI
jgi:hypothetical protein